MSVSEMGATLPPPSLPPAPLVRARTLRVVMDEKKEEKKEALPPHLSLLAPPVMHKAFRPSTPK